jgi:hypothetical protein
MLGGKQNADQCPKSETQEADQQSFADYFASHSTSTIVILRSKSTKIEA